MCKIAAFYEPYLWEMVIVKTAVDCNRPKDGFLTSIWALALQWRSQNEIAAERGEPWALDGLHTNTHTSKAPVMLSPRTAPAQIASSELDMLARAKYPNTRMLRHNNNSSIQANTVTQIMTHTHTYTHRVKTFGLSPWSTLLKWFYPNRSPAASLPLQFFTHTHTHLCKPSNESKEDLQHSTSRTHKLQLLLKMYSI